MDLPNSEQLAEIFKNGLEFRGKFAFICINKGINGIIDTMKLG
jgi:hypothetical protein